MTSSPSEHAEYRSASPYIIYQSPSPENIEHIHLGQSSIA
jgi:hypothetical protein